MNSTKHRFPWRWATVCSLALAGAALICLIHPVSADSEPPPSPALKRKVKSLTDAKEQPYQKDLLRLRPALLKRLDRSAPRPKTADEIRQAELEKRYEFPFFRSGEERVSVHGRLDTSLAVVYAERKVWRPATFSLKTSEQLSPAGVIDTKLRSYDGLAVGPTLRVKAGDVLRVRLDNRLPVEKAKEHVVNVPSEFNRTNLHTHGLHVTPAGNGDNVLLEVRPGETHLVEVAIPPDHVPGTFWYHSHVHGSTAVQVSSGMAGALIVEPRDGDKSSLDAIPEIKNAEERVCVLQQLSYHLEAGSPATAPRYVLEDFAAAFGPVPDSQLPPPPATRPTRWDAGEKQDGWRTTINGQLQPVIQVRSGRLQRFRFIHAGVRQMINVQLSQVATNDGAPVPESLLYDLDQLNEDGMREIAVDGIPLDRTRRATTVTLFPGYRSDVLTRLINETDKPQYYIMWDGVTGRDVSLDPTLPAGTDWTKRTDVLAILEVLPAEPGKAADRWPSEHDFAGVRRPTPIPDHELVGLQTAELSVGGGQFRINGVPYDPKAEPLKLKIGRADEWRLTSTGNQAHPFHIHVNPFYVVSVTDNASGITTPLGVWRDTLVAEGTKTYTVRTRYENYLGDFVFHCHLLDHEDEGMMRGVRIVNSAYEVGTKIARPYLVPMWTLPDATGGEKSLTSLMGTRLTVLIFIEGQTCVACSAQMRQYKDLKARIPADVNVVFIAPKEQQMGFPGADFPFPVVFDKTLDQFKAYRVYSEEHRTSLHGTFVLEKSGRVRWREVSNQPYTDLNALIAEFGQIK